MTVELIVELQDKLLQHMHLLALHLNILGYTLCLLWSVRLLKDDKRWIDDFKGDITTLGPL